MAKLFHLVQHIFYAEPKEAKGSWHQYDLVYATDKNKALKIAEKHMKMAPEIQACENEITYENGTYIQYGELLYIKKVDKRYKTALQRKLDKLAYRGYAEISESEYYILNEVETDTEYESFYTRKW